MKRIFKYTSILGLCSIFMFSCNRFEDINKDPNAASENQIKIDYLLNQSIYQAQMNPHIAERVFIQYWDRVARYEAAGVLSIFNSNNDWSSDYYGSDYMSKWLTCANLTVNIGNKRIKEGSASSSTSNIVQMARIWRAYLYSEMCDNFGPIPIEGAYQGENPQYNSIQYVYSYIINELKEASAAIDTEQALTVTEQKSDILFAGNLTSWIKYATSLRLRFAMRMSNANYGLAKSEFETAASDLSQLITTSGDVAAVQEQGGWDPTTGVMSRPWNTQFLSLTLANLTIGIGGVTLDDMKGVKGLAAYNLSDDIISQYSKDPDTYLGLKMSKYLPTTTNVNNAGYMMDYIPYVVDPRALKNFSIPGYDDGEVAWRPNATIAKLLFDASTNPDTVRLRAKYTWNGLTFGERGSKGTLFASYTNTNDNTPAKSAVLRDNYNKRVFFGPWETYFLIAEAAYYGWSVPMSAKDAYEAGVNASFSYQNIPLSLAQTYLASEDYNRVGTSAKFDHTSEITSSQMNYVDLDANLVAASGHKKSWMLKDNPDVSTISYTYPKGIYSTNNDQLTKIITQKYLSQLPWLPNEAWCDYRRLALPFMENPMLENPIATMPNYTNYSVASINNIPQRLRYPQFLITVNKTGYDQALTELGGPDEITTPMWWSKK